MDVDAVQRLLQRLEELEEAEEERLRQQIIDTRVKLAVAERLAAMQPKLKRSEMSAFAKSKFLRDRIAAGRSGAEAQADYMALPWR
jgi:hypothetical protein